MDDSEVVNIDEISICEICGATINKIDYKKHVRSHQKEKNGKYLIKKFKSINDTLIFSQNL